MVQPTKVGTILDEFDDEFAEWFEEDVTVRNFLNAEDAGVTRDEYGDIDPEDRKPLHPDSPISTTAQVDRAGSNTESETYGLSTRVDVEIRLDPTVLVTNGGGTDSQDRELPFPSEIDDAKGRTYTVVDVFDQGNGAKLVLAQYDK